MLSDAAYRVETTSELPTVLDLARQFHPDVILINLGMREMSGFQLSEVFHLIGPEGD